MCALELLQKNSIPVTESGCWLGKVRIVDLAERFGIHYTQVSRIQNGRFWEHLSTTERMG